MSIFFFNNKNYQKETIFYIILYLTLIISFIFGENSTGGAFIDYANSKKAVQSFASEFLNTFYEYDTFRTRHSPVIKIFLSIFERINIPDFFIRLIHLHLCLLLPIFFYKCLSIKYSEIDKKIFLLLSALIFLSPTFRTLAIWPDSRLLGLILFTLSIYYFLKFENNKIFKYAIYNIITLSLSAYMSPNFSVFAVFFMLRFISNYGFFSKKILFLIFLNFLLALPAFYYIFIIGVNFFLQSAAVGMEDKDSIFFNNLFNDTLITFSIIFFYLTPFILFKVIKLEYFLNIKNFIVSTSIFLICLINFDYVYSYTGGGFFFKLSNFIFGNNYLFYIVSFLATLIVCSLITKSYLNILLFVLIILNNPQYTIYHKYFDPFLLITFFTIFLFNMDLNKISEKKNYLFIFTYFLGFLLLSNLKLVLIN